jgi:hypothetical protein
MNKCEVVVEVLAEGGSIALIGARHGCGWTFSRSVNDSTSELIGEKPIFHKSAEVDSWEDALGLLDKYPWQTFYPSKVHPESGLLYRSDSLVMRKSRWNWKDGATSAPKGEVRSDDQQS